MNDVGLENLWAFVSKALVRNDSFVQADVTAKCTRGNINPTTFFFTGHFCDALCFMQLNTMFIS